MTVSKSEHDQWPFYADTVELSQPVKSCAVVRIEGRDYALNGNAAMQFGMINVHAGGQAIFGQPTTEFIRLALEIPVPTTVRDTYQKFKDGN